MAAEAHREAHAIAADKNGPVERAILRNKRRHAQIQVLRHMTVTPWRSHDGTVNPVIATIDQDVAVVSVVDLGDDGLRHRYRLVGGPENGREFDTLNSVAEYARDHGGAHVPPPPQPD
jgi:hypothetical protein